MEKMYRLDVVEVFSIKYNLVDNQYQQKSDVLYTFTPNKSYVYLLNVKAINFWRPITLSL